LQEISTFFSFSRDILQLYQAPLIPEDDQVLPDKTMGTGKAIKRLLAESLPDLHIIIFAFVCLFLAAGSDLFNPWFIGRIINDIVITRNGCTNVFWRK